MEKSSVEQGTGIMKYLYCWLSVALTISGIRLSAEAASQLPDLSVPRSEFFAIARGDGSVYVFGGTTPGANAPFEIYSPTAGSRVLLTAGVPQCNADIDGALLIDGDRILLCLQLNCAVYEPTTNSWQEKTVEGGASPLVRLFDGRVLRAGGVRGLFSRRDAHIIDTTTFRAIPAADMTESRWTRVIVVLPDGRVLAAGGVDRVLGVPQPLKTAEVFDPRENTWRRIADTSRVSGLIRGIGLRDGRVLAGHEYDAEIYDISTNAWTSARPFVIRAFSRMIVLPNDEVVVTGGLDLAASATSAVTFFDPVTMQVRDGRPLEIPRARHGLTLLNDGRVIVIGGVTTGGTLTKSVERLTWEPRIKRSGLNGFVVATSSASEVGGFWGLEITAPGRLHGGLNFGGTVPARGTDVGFAGFNLPQAQTVTGRIDFQPLGSGNFEAIVRLLDVNKQPVSPEIRGGTHIEFSQQLQPGFYVVEVQTRPNSPTASYQFALSAPVLSGGAVAGGVLDPATGVPGFAGFYLAEPQDVTVRLLNEQTYGSPRGAGEVILTLYDSQGRVIARQGPGAMNPGN